jgi:hypothetical protein
MDVLAAIVADIHAQKPDHIAMTGDILNIGLTAEFPLAAAWLETLGPADKVSFVPGNHDAYTRGSMPHVASTFAKWTTSDASGESGFPYLRMRNGVALIGRFSPPAASAQNSAPVSMRCLPIWRGKSYRASSWCTIRRIAAAAARDAVCRTGTSSRRSSRIGAPISSSTGIITG